MAAPSAVDDLRFHTLQWQFVSGLHDKMLARSDGFVPRRRQFARRLAGLPIRSVIDKGLHRHSLDSWLIPPA